MSVWDVLISLLSGGFAGMGLGGGWLLMAYLLASGYADRPQARAIVLLLFLPAAAVSLVGQVKSGLVDCKRLWLPMLLGMAAVFAGMWLSALLDELTVRRIMVVLLGAVGVSQIVGALKPKKQ